MACTPDPADAIANIEERNRKELELKYLLEAASSYEDSAKDNLEYATREYQRAARAAATARTSRTQTCNPQNPTSRLSPQNLTQNSPLCPALLPYTAKVPSRPRI